MIYLDASALVSIYVPEPASDSVERLVAADSDPAISDLGRLEMYSAVNRRVRMRELSRHHGNAILNSFEADVTARVLRVISLESSHFQRARDFLARFEHALRTLEAIHLALSAAEQLQLLTLDRSMARTARSLGIPVRAIRF